MVENLNETNITTNITSNDIPASYVIFLVNMVICVLMGIGTVLGNLIVIVTVTRKKSSGIFRYVNEVVRNLAITDALFGLVGVPLTMVYWYWGKLQVSNHRSIKYYFNITYSNYLDLISNMALIFLSGQSGEMAMIKENDEDWKIALIRVFPMSLQGSSCFLVSLIVYFRLKVMNNPIEFEQNYRKTGRYVSIMIWIFSFAVNLLPCLVSINKTGGIRDDDIRRHIFSGSFLVVLHTTTTVPVFLSAVFYLCMLWSLRSFNRRCSYGDIQRDIQLDVQGDACELNRRCSFETVKRTKSLTKFINTIVLCLVACNVPYIIWYQYIGQLAIEGNISAYLATTHGVSLFL